MRIGLSTSVIQRGKTGIAQHLFALLREFAAQDAGDEFVLYVLEEDEPLFDFVRGAMRIVRVPEEHRPPVKNVWWHQRVLPRLVSRDRLDVLHVPSYRRLLWRAPCPKVATIHDLAPFRVPKKYDPLRMLYGRVVVRRLAWKQDAIIAISQNTAHDITTFFGIPPERISIIYNGLEHGRFFPGDSLEARVAASGKYGLPAPFFLYVARLEHPGKNHVRLIAAFDAFKRQTKSNWLLALAGSDWHGAEAIHQAAASSPFARDIRFLGFVADGALPELYRAADAFVYPSLYEGFGMPPLEAMACGCPVISSARGSLGEVVGKAAALVEPDDVHSIAQQLLRVGMDGQVREELRLAGLAQARCFDWNIAARKTLDVYRNAVRE